MFSSTKLQSKMLFFNWQTWIIMCTLFSHSDPFINGLLNTGGIGPKLLAWFWEAQRMRRTQDTKHKNRGGYVSAMLAQEGRASSARRDGHSSITAQPAHHRALTASHQPGPCPEPPSLQPAPGKADNRKCLEGNGSAPSYPSKRQCKWLALGLSGRTAAARREGQSSRPYCTDQLTKGSGNYILKSRVHSGIIYEAINPKENEALYRLRNNKQYVHAIQTHKCHLR